LAQRDHGQLWEHCKFISQEGQPGGSELLKYVDFFDLGGRFDEKVFEIVGRVDVLIEVEAQIAADSNKVVAKTAPLVEVEHGFDGCATMGILDRWVLAKDDQPD